MRHGASLAPALVSAELARKHMPRSKQRKRAKSAPKRVA
jgi:hypothetical protein